MTGKVRSNVHSIQSGPHSLSMYRHTIRDFPDHATFREKCISTGLWSDKLMDSLSLPLCNKTNFDPLQFVKYAVFGKKVEL